MNTGGATPFSRQRTAADGLSLLTASLPVGSQASGMHKPGHLKSKSGKAGNAHRIKERGV